MAGGGGAKNRIAGCQEYAELDPSGRYGRYDEILGKGASKTVFKAFDEYRGVEVAWNQVKLQDFLKSEEDLERLYCEIHLLKTLRHRHIMRFHCSWVDVDRRNINFITEMFTSGTLRQYRQRHRRVSMRAVKHWCRQILSGLQYLHSHDPPIIHRDLKCDNIFVNGHQGEVKIGDLGLAAILRKSHAVHCVGTPEFMAPEVYAEEYNELVDIYSFGMCVLEMVTFEYPYSECSSPVEIYRRVVSGTKPEALYKVKDAAVRAFIEKCLAGPSRRLSAKELLQEPFLRGDDGFLYSDEGDDVTDCVDDEVEKDNGGKCGEDDDEIRECGIDLFDGHEEDEERLADVDIAIKGKKREDGTVFLRLRITDGTGHVRKIHFRFDIESDTALSVATEMVEELDITDHEVTRIADMIDGEVSALVPDWKPGPSLEGCEETPTELSTAYCENCGSTVTSSSSSSFLDYLSSKQCACRCAEPALCLDFDEEDAPVSEAIGEHEALRMKAVPSTGNLSLTSAARHLTPKTGSLKRVLHQSLDFDNMAITTGRIPVPVPAVRPSLASHGRMESFHFSKNNFYRIPSFAASEENGAEPPPLSTTRQGEAEAEQTGYAGTDHRPNYVAVAAGCYAGALLLNSAARRRSLVDNAVDS